MILCISWRLGWRIYAALEPPPTQVPEPETSAQKRGKFYLGTAIQAFVEHHVQHVSFNPFATGGSQLAQLNVDPQPWDMSLVKSVTLAMLARMC